MSIRVLRAARVGDEERQRGNLGSDRFAQWRWIRQLEASVHGLRRLAPAVAPCRCETVANKWTRMWKVVPVFVVVGNGETGSCRKNLCISQWTAPVQRIIFFELVGQPGHIIRKIFQRGQIQV